MREITKVCIQIVPKARSTHCHISSFYKERKGMMKRRTKLEKGLLHSHSQQTLNKLIAIEEDIITSHHLDLVIPISHIQTRKVFTSCQSINRFTYFGQWVVTSLTFLRSIQYLTVPSIFLTNTVGDTHSDTPLEIIPASKVFKCMFLPPPLKSKWHPAWSLFNRMRILGVYDMFYD